MHAVRTSEPRAIAATAATIAAPALRWRVLVMQPLRERRHLEGRLPRVRQQLRRQCSDRLLPVRLCRRPAHVHPILAAAADAAATVRFWCLVLRPLRVLGHVAKRLQQLRGKL